MGKCGHGRCGAVFGRQRENRGKRRVGAHVKSSELSGQISSFKDRLKKNQFEARGTEKLIKNNEDDIVKLVNSKEN